MRKYLVIPAIILLTSCSLFQTPNDTSTTYKNKVAALYTIYGEAESLRTAYVTQTPCWKPGAVKPVCADITVSRKLDVSSKKARVAIAAADKTQDELLFNAAQTAVDAYKDIAGGK